MDSTCDPHDGAPCAGGCETAAWAMRPMHDQFPMTIQRVRRNCIVRSHNFGGARAAGCLPGRGGAAWREHRPLPLAWCRPRRHPQAGSITRPHARASVPGRRSGRRGSRGSRARTRRPASAWCRPRRHPQAGSITRPHARASAPGRRSGRRVVMVVPEQGVQRRRGAGQGGIRRPAPSPGRMPAPMRRAGAVAVVVVVPVQGVQRRRGAGHAEIRRPAPSPSRMPSPVRRAGAVAVAWAWSCKASSVGVVPATPRSAGRLHHRAACPRQCAGPAQWPSSWSCPNKASSRRCDGPHSPIAGWISMALQASRWLPLSAASIAACS